MLIIPFDSGLLRLDDGSSIKEFEDKESDFALQSIVSSVSAEDIRYIVRRFLSPIPTFYKLLTFFHRTGITCYTSRD